MSTLNAPSIPNAPNGLIKAGAAMFFLWGVLHVYAGYLSVAPFFSDGPGANLALFGVEIGGEALTPVIKAASHVTLNFGFDLAGYGILAIWLSWLIWNGRHVLLSFSLIVVILGIADGAFIYSLLLPGYSPLLEGLAGPVLYVLGTLFTAIGLKQLSAGAAT